MEASQWPLVGRDDELALAGGALGDGGSVVLTGAAGVGKTRLAREVLARAARDGDRTEWVAATQAAATVPLGAVAGLVPASALGRGREGTLRAIVAALERTGEGGRLLLGVDDAHLLDDASAALVHVLVTSGTAAAVLTVRSGERTPDSITALWKDGPASLIALQPLARPEVDQLVTDALDGVVDGGALHALWESSRGNALFLRELVRDGIESGALRHERDLWRWQGPIEPGERLQDLVAVRTDRLDDDERAALELLAVGEPLTIECLRGLGIVELVEHLERRGLARMAREGRGREVRLAHPLFGDVVRAAMPPTRLDDVRRRLADAVEAVGDLGPADLLRIASWRADAGDHDHPEQLTAAARRAWVLGDARVAERLARAALESGPNFEAGYLLGEALSDQGRAHEALDAWRQVEALDGSDRVRASMAVAQGGVLAYQLDDPIEAATVLQRAADRIVDDAARNRLAGSLALFAATHPSASGIAAGPQIEDDPPLTAPNAALAAALEHAGAGALEVALRTAEDALAAGQVLEEQPTILQLLRMTRAWAHLQIGQVAAAEADVERYYRGAVDESAELERARWALMRGLIAVARGRPLTAGRLLREATAILESADMGFLRPARAYLAMAAAISGDTGAADANMLAAATGSHSIDRVFAVDVARATAWVLAARGELSAAADAAAAAAAQAVGGGQWAREAFAQHDVARFGAAADVVRRLEELAEIVDGPVVDAFALHARGLVDADGPDLDRAAETLAALGFDLFAAEAAFEASKAHRRAGKKASAFVSAERARKLLAVCEGAHTPALSQGEQPDDLTGREREVAELAAGGLASKEIAGRLGITARTVDNLLGRVYTKLGVSSRTALTEVFRPERRDPAL